MKSFFKNVLSTMVGIILATITSIILIIAVISIIISSSESQKNINLKENSILRINLTKNKVVERNINNPLKNINPSTSVINTIEIKANMIPAVMP